MFPPRRYIPRLGPPKLSPRQRALASLRGAANVRDEVVYSHREKTAGQLMGALVKDLRLDRRQAEGEIVRSWNTLLDPNITAHAQPTGYNHKTGTVFVNVDNSVWLSEIVRYRRKEILDRLQHTFGKEVVSKISFRIG